MGGKMRLGQRWAWLPSGLAVLVALACAVGLAVATAAPDAAAVRPAADGCGPRWVTGWQAAVQPAPGEPGLVGATVRMVVRPQVTGSEVPSSPRVAVTHTTRDPRSRAHAISPPER